MKWQRARIRVPKANVIGEAWVKVGPPERTVSHEIDRFGRRTGKTGIRDGYETNLVGAAGTSIGVSAALCELLPEFTDAAAPVDLFEWIVANQDL